MKNPIFAGSLDLEWPENFRRGWSARSVTLSGRHYH